MPDLHSTPGVMGSDLTARVHSLGLSGRIERAPNGADLRLIAADTVVTISGSGAHPVLTLADLRSGRDVFSLPDPGDVMAGLIVPWVLPEGALVTVLPPASDMGPIDAIVPGRMQPGRTARGIGWTRLTVSTPQSRLWLAYMHGRASGTFPVQSDTPSVPGLLYRPGVCHDSASVAEYMADLGWPYLAFPQVFVWHVDHAGAERTLWAAATPACVDALVIAALLLLESPELGIAECLEQIMAQEAAR
jgi:hypothetical protein